MSKPAMKAYPAEFKERAVKLAVESGQPVAQTARDLGVNENTLHTGPAGAFEQKPTVLT
jgi:transposase